jgi:hypothetical protein
MMVAVGAFVVARRRAPWPRPTAARMATLVVVALAWGWGLSTAELTPAEKTHFVTYGVLAWFVLRAVEVDRGGPASYLIAALVVGVLGWGEEVIQYYMPRRHFEWKDVGLNLVSGVLALAAIHALRGPER